MTTQKSKALVSESSKAAVYELPFIQQGDQFLYDARLLHRNLQVQTKFEDWIKRRINDFKFEKGVDYFSNLRIVKHSKKPVAEYLLTLDMCKELGMLERSEIGRAIRKRFIQKEKEARGVSLLPKESGLFKGLKPRRINDREMYPYREILVRSGYVAASNGDRRHRYWMHFVKEGNLLYVTREFAEHLYHQKQVYNNRKAMLAALPVLPFNFGEPLQIQGGIA